MSRIPRFLKSDTSTIYHIMSRTALDGYPLSDVGKDVLLGLIKKFSSFYVVDVLGFALMGNHVLTGSDLVNHPIFRQKHAN